MRVELMQRHGLMRRTYALADDGIRVSERSLTRGRTVTVPYEVMFGDREGVFSASKHALIAAAVMAVLAVICAVAQSEPYAWLFWGVFAAFAGGYYWASRRDLVGFVDPKASIFFLRDKPSQTAVEEFVAAARARARERVRDRILPLRATDDAEADRQRATWLREAGIITDEEHADFTQRRSLVVATLDANERKPN